MILTSNEYEFKGFIIPKGTKVEILEIVENNDLKVYFHNGDNEECIQILTIDEFNNL